MKELYCRKEGEFMEKTTQQNAIQENHTKLFLLTILLTNVLAILNTSIVNIALSTYVSIFQVNINTVHESLLSGCWQYRYTSRRHYVLSVGCY